MKKSKEGKKSLYWLFFSLFCFTSVLILIESCLPSYVSSIQSDSIGDIVVGLINSWTTPKEKTPVYASNISFSYPQDKNLLQEKEAIIGTTKLINYKLDFPEIDKKRQEKHYDDLNCFVSKGDKNGLQMIFSPNSSTGSLRIIPLKEDNYEITFKSNNFSKSISFSSIGNKAITNDMVSYFGEEVIEINDGLSSQIKYSYSLLNSSKKEYDYSYLMRFFKESNNCFSSSNEDIFKIDCNYIVPISVGEASLLLNEKEVSRIKVNSVATFASSTPVVESKDLHPLDYDFTFECGIDLPFDYPITYSSSNPLIGKVLNSYYKKNNGDVYELIRPKVFGYRDLGEVKITGRFIGTNSSFDINLISKELKATSFELSPTVNNSKVDFTNHEFVAGDLVYLNPIFNPKNASQGKIHLEGNNIEIYNNDTSYPSFKINKAGEINIVVSMGEFKKEYKLKSIDAPTITKEDEAKVHYSLRKILGHFLLFGFEGIFASITLYLSSFKTKKDKYYIYPCVVLFGFFIALLSESFQAIPALRRGPSIIDASIDYAGYLSGFLLVTVIYLLSLFIRKVNEKRKTKNI